MLSVWNNADDNIVTAQLDLNIKVNNLTIDLYRDTETASSPI